MPEHATLGASSSHIWMNCSEAAKHMGKSRPASSYADAGTLAHQVIEMAAHHNESAHDYVGTELNEAVFGTEDAIAVSVMLGYIQDLELDNLQLEKTVYLDELFMGNPPTPLFGTADVSGTKGKTLHVADYKHGAGIFVDVKNNSQLMYYGLGVAYDFMMKGIEFNEVCLTVVQPRHVMGGVKEWKLPSEDLFKWAETELKPAIDKAVYGPHEYNPGEHCRFCPHLGSCPAVHKLSQDTAKMDFSDENAVPAAANELTDAELSEVLNNSDTIKSFLKAVEGEAINRVMERDGALTGWKVVNTQARRKWNCDAIEVAEIMGASAYTQSLVSPAQAEKILGKSVYQKELAGKVDKVSSGLTLAKESDPRKAVVSKPQDDFNDDFLT